MPHTSLPYRVWLGHGQAHYTDTYAAGLAYLEQLAAQGLDTAALHVEYVGPERRQTLREAYDAWLYESPLDTFIGPERRPLESLGLAFVESEYVSAPKST